MQFFERLFRPWKSRNSATATSIAEPQLPSLLLSWRSDTTMPIVDWDTTHKQAPQPTDTEAANTYWRAAAMVWLDALREHLGPSYTITCSTSFAMLSSLQGRQRQLTLDFCERSRRRILSSLEGIASAWGHGPHALLLFDDSDTYLDYIGNYYPNSGEFKIPGGVFLRKGYGHFALISSDLSRMERVIAHELTHCLLAPLPIPLWLNEGTAVNMEKLLVPRGINPRQGIFAERDRIGKRAAFWNEETIQQFWSGRSFSRPDEASEFSYELAEVLTRLIAKDYEQYRVFMNRAHRSDAGSAAAAVLGVTLGELAGAVLGRGDWRPDPHQWQMGIQVQ